MEDDKPESMGKLYDFVAKMDDRQFRRAQIIFGCAIGLLGALALMIPIGDSTGSSMWSFVIALFILVWLPNIVERKTDKKIPTARKWMLIVFVIGMALVMGINALNRRVQRTSDRLSQPERIRRAQRHAGALKSGLQDRTLVVRSFCIASFAMLLPQSYCKSCDCFTVF